MTAIRCRLRFAGVLAAVVAASVFAGCSTLVPPDDCALGEVSGMTIASCGSPEEVRVEHWEKWIPRILAVFDDELLAAGLPPMSGLVAGYTIRIEKREPGGKAAGIYSPSTLTIKFFPERPSGGWYINPTTHELWHLYEHEAMFLSGRGWAELQKEDPPRHFLTGGLGASLHSRVRSRTDLTAWDCDGGYDMDIFYPPPENWDGGVYCEGE